MGLTRTSSGLLLYDNFSSDTESNYTREGSDTWAVSDGVIADSGTTSYTALHRPAITTAKCMTARARENTTSDVFDPVGIAADGATFDSTYHHPESGYVLQLYYGDLYLYKEASGETELDSDTGFNASYTTYYVYRLYISSGVVYGNAGATALAAKVQANEMDTARDVQERAPCAYGVFGIIYNGRLLSYNYMDPKDFNKRVAEVAG